MKKTVSLFLSTVILSAFLLNCAGVAKEGNLLASAAVAKDTSLLGFAGVAKETRMICPRCGAAFTSDERIEKYYHENFGGGFK